MPTKFKQKVFEKLKQIPSGRVTTYGLLARAVGLPKAARAVGNALNKNPDAPAVPCHRVVLSDGRLGGYAFGADKKIVLLEGEGVMIKNGRVVDFENKVYEF